MANNGTIRQVVLYLKATLLRTLFCFEVNPKESCCYCSSVVTARSHGASTVGSFTSLNLISFPSYFD